jgi:hypothetical protein
MKTKNKLRQENILKCNKALENGDALQSTRRWTTNNKVLNMNTKMRNIVVQHFAKHEAQTPKCKMFQ